MFRRIFRWAVILTALALFQSTALGAEDGRYAVSLTEGAVLLDAEGNELVPTGEYSVLYELYGLPEGVQLYAGEAADGEFGGYALVGPDGEALTGFDYQMLEYADGAILFMKGERLGLMDLEGGVLTEAVYTSLVSNGEGGYLALKTDPYDDAPDGVYWIDESGEAHGTGIKITGGLYPVSEGMSEAASADNGLYGYLDAEGKWAIQPGYEWAGAFRGGRAMAAGSGGMGLIDANGNWLITPKYDSIHYEEDGLILAFSGESLSVMEPEKYEVVAEYSGSGVYGYSAAGGKAVVLDGERAVILNREGKEIFSLEGCQSVSNWEGMEDQAVVSLGDFGTASVWLYRMDGEALAGPYQDIMPLGEMNGQMYYTFTSFEATQVEYEEYGLSFWDEVPGTRRCGVLSPEGEELCSFKAEYISYLGEGRMLIQAEVGAAFADFEGNVLRSFEGFETEGTAE